MDIIRVIYQGFSVENHLYANCIMMIRQKHFSVSRVYEISVAEKYLICSPIHLDVLIESACEREGGEFWAAYQAVVADMYSLTCFNYAGSRRPAVIPRFSEADFAAIIKELGGEKIKECCSQTPDFSLGSVVFELKDLQLDSLKNEDRQAHIAELFLQHPDRCIDLDPNTDYGELTKGYHQLIQSTIHNHLKKASSQIKSYRKMAEVSSAGMIFLNTGMFSLPHELFKSLLADLLVRRTKTIRFALSFHR